MSPARYPGATWAPLPESGGGVYTRTQLIYHSTGTRASAAANRRYFADAKVSAESTFIVDYDGSCLQVMEAYDKADANVSASRRAMSVEVVGVASEPYTPEQVARCIDIGKWALAEHSIEPRRCPEHDASGLGWHVMFGAPGPWTLVRGKECPGGQRIAQVRDVIIPAVCKPVAPPPPPAVVSTEEPLMRVLTIDNGALVMCVHPDGLVTWVPTAADAKNLKRVYPEVKMTRAEYDAFLKTLADQVGRRPRALS